MKDVTITFSRATGRFLLQGTTPSGFGVEIDFANAEVLMCYCRQQGLEPTVGQVLIN